ncbi:hypothetical protein N1851_004580 [Merluccius polli]|uniref:Uncharacterized protein n=1 Tax=Merluccius polli TaxID=89951 RepID=A0AA47P768_MERPO|nr:hypothetical protein N1851_004580 [Merluccius polli]
MTQIGYLRDLLQNYWQDFKVCVLQSCWQEVEGEVVESFTECQQHVSSLLKAVHQHRLLLLQRFQKRVVDHMNQLEDAFKSLSNIETEILVGLLPTVNQAKHKDTGRPSVPTVNQAKHKDTGRPSGPQWPLDVFLSVLQNFFRSEVQSLASFCDQQQRRLASLEDKNQEEMTERKNGKEDGEKEERVVIKK